MTSRPYYGEAPIASLRALARKLGRSEAELIRLAKRAPQLYFVAGRVPKADGSQRTLYDCRPSLKSVHGYIVTRLLRKVQYPSYLQGGIRDSDNPRDYVRDAAIHTNGRIIITEDVAQFFPSISAEQVWNIWRRFFRFPDPVASCLTDLTTRSNELPQGARTSTYLANLVFFDVEPDLYLQLESQGMTYSRFVDDINISTARTLTQEEKSEAVAAIIGMMGRKQRKRSISDVLVRPSGIMDVLRPFGSGAWRWRGRTKAARQRTAHVTRQA